MSALKSFVRRLAYRYYGRQDAWALREAAKHLASMALMRGRTRVLAGALALQVTRE